MHFCFLHMKTVICTLENIEEMGKKSLYVISQSFENLIRVQRLVLRVSFSKIRFAHGRKLNTADMSITKVSMMIWLHEAESSIDVFL